MFSLLFVQPVSCSFVYCTVCVGEFRRKFVSVLDRCRCSDREMQNHHSLYLNAATRLQTISPNTRSLNHCKSFREKQASSYLTLQITIIHRVARLFNVIHGIKYAIRIQRRSLFYCWILPYYPTNKLFGKTFGIISESFLIDASNGFEIEAPYIFLKLFPNRLSAGYSNNKFVSYIKYECVYDLISQTMQTTFLENICETYMGNNGDSNQAMALTTNGGTSNGNSMPNGGDASTKI